MKNTIRDTGFRIKLGPQPPAEPKPTDMVTFKSGATSGGTRIPYFRVPVEGGEETALRFDYGNQKHEAGNTVLADANWLKAFHARDLEFFQNRAAHAYRHFQRELSGDFDSRPGGNLGAVGWWQAVFAFVRRHDFEFYKAICGLIPHPGERKENCACPCSRCMAAVNAKV